MNYWDMSLKCSVVSSVVVIIVAIFEHTFQNELVESIIQWKRGMNFDFLFVWLFILSCIAMTNEKTTFRKFEIDFHAFP